MAAMATRWSCWMAVANADTLYCLLVLTPSPHAPPSDQHTRLPLHTHTHTHTHTQVEQANVEQKAAMAIDEANRLVAQSDQWRNEEITARERAERERDDAVAELAKVTAVLNECNPDQVVWYGHNIIIIMA